ncbi:carboxymuconolactone decarboxylase family protein [Streptomyces sp. NPDC051976]|uniref:carboxymuconolactone decarboxylase family protein n=1 Tax=Streptomyces sp. NPDC051976 TaxID=3154947 RepID=UPI00341959D8
MTTNTTHTTHPAHDATAEQHATVHRLDLASAAPKVFKALIGFDVASRAGLDPILVELVQTRASQINGCAYCLFMHTKDARKRGESEERLYLLATWREAAHFYTAKEQAALALTEAVTLISHDGVPDDVYARAAEHFDDAELAQLLGLILTINTWNRIALTSRKVPGTDQRQ